jgi:hypothetical protein
MQPRGIAERSDIRDLLYPSSRRRFQFLEFCAKIDQ